MKMQTPATLADTAPDPADLAIAQAEARQRRRRRRLIVGGVASLIVSYPLSFGSLLFLDSEGHVPTALYAILRIIYFPLVFAIEYVPYVKECYEWYLGIDL